MTVFRHAEKIIPLYCMQTLNSSVSSGTINHVYTKSRKSFCRGGLSAIRYERVPTSMLKKRNGTPLAAAYWLHLLSHSNSSQQNKYLYSYLSQTHITKPSGDVGRMRQHTKPRTTNRITLARWPL